MNNINYQLKLKLTAIWPIRSLHNCQLQFKSPLLVTEYNYLNFVFFFKDKWKLLNKIILFSSLCLTVSHFIELFRKMCNSQDFHMVKGRYLNPTLKRDNNGDISRRKDSPISPHAEFQIKRSKQHILARYRALANKSLFTTFRVVLLYFCSCVRSYIHCHFMNLLLSILLWYFVK